MCTYATVRTDLTGSAKGPGSAWFRVTDATVYYDHPEGWVSDDYQGFRQAILPAMVEQLEQQISDHLNPDLLRAMAMRNMFHCVRRQTVANSHQQFEQMLRQVFL